MVVGWTAVVWCGAVQIAGSMAAAAGQTASADGERWRAFQREDAAISAAHAKQRSGEFWPSRLRKAERVIIP